MSPKLNSGIKALQEFLGRLPESVRCSKCGGLFGCNCSKELLQSDIPSEGPFQLSSKPERENRVESFKDRLKESFERAIHGCQKCGSRFGCRCSEVVTADDIPEVSLLSDSGLTDPLKHAKSEPAPPALKEAIDLGQKNPEVKRDAKDTFSENTVAERKSSPDNEPKNMSSESKVNVDPI